MNKILKSLTIILILTLAFGSCKEKNETNEQAKSKYDQILEKGEIEVGYISYPPSFIVNPDGSKSGIFHDVMEEIGKNLGLEIVYKDKNEVTWDGMIESLKQDKVDMVVTGIWPTSQRGKHVDFAKPLFYSVVKAYTKYGNDQFDNDISKINSDQITIATIDGEMTSIIAELDFPNAKVKSEPQLTGVSQTLLNIKEGKANITFVEPAVALEFAEKNPNSIQEVKGVEPLRVFPNSMMLPKGATELTNTLNIAIQELQNNGFIDKIIAKYEKYPNSYYKVQIPYKSNN